MNCFCVKVECYCHDLKISFKGLFLLYNAVGHLVHLNELHPKVRDISAAQHCLLNQAHGSVKTAVKMCCLRWPLSWLLTVADGPEQAIWSLFLVTIQHPPCSKRNQNCIGWTQDQILEWSLEDCVERMCSWLKGFVTRTSEVTWIIDLGLSVRFDNLEADMIQLLESHRKEKTAENLVRLTLREDQPTIKRHHYLIQLMI